MFENEAEEIQVKSRSMYFGEKKLIKLIQKALQEAYEKGLKRAVEICKSVVPRHIECTQKAISLIEKEIK